MGQLPAIVNSQFVEFLILGEPASKANSREPKVRTSKAGKIYNQWQRSPKAKAYATWFQYQCRRLEPLLEGDLYVEIDIWYASRRPDLDESIILDAMQGLIYVNDRQVKRKIVTWHLDRENPRSLIKVGHHTVEE